MQKNSSLYSTSNEISFQFIKLPKIILDDKKLSMEAKFAFSLMLDRLSLSKENNWADNKGNLFIIYTREGLANELNVSMPTIIKAINELKDNSYIIETRQGQR